MYITLRQLEIFCAAAKYLNFSKAAESLCMSPPAVTKQIQTLEAECRCHFFEQVGRVIYLTDEGKKLLEQVNNIDREMLSLKRLVLDLSHQSDQIINISLGHTFENIIFKAMQAFKNTHPSIAFNIFVESRANQCLNLESNDRDLCVMCLPDKNSDFTQVKILDMPFVLVCSSKNPLLQQTTLNVNAIKDEALVLIKSTTLVEDKAHQIINHSRLQNNRRIILDSYVAVKDAVIAGLGIGFLPKSLIEEKDVNDLKILPIKSFSYSAPLVVMHRKHKKLTGAMKEFIALLRKLKC